MSTLGLEPEVLPRDSSGAVQRHGSQRGFALPTFVPGGAVAAWGSIAIHSLLFMCIGMGFSRAETTSPGLACGSERGALNCSKVLPGAVRFESYAGSHYQTGFGPNGELVGWVALSTDVVDITAYSGKPLVTLIGIDPEGVFTGVQVLEHNEPILLVGLPETALDEFVRHYVGKDVATRMVVGRSDTAETLSIDAISGATVTALAQNQTVLAVGRKLAMDVGVLNRTRAVGGHFVERAVPLTWAEMEAEGVFGRLYVSEEMMGGTATSTEHGQFMNLWFTIADAPQVGRSLFGDREYKWLREHQREGEHLVVILGAGSSSFKGSGFVRGGIFDRIRLEQGMQQFFFRDTDYRNVSVVRSVGAPQFKEGAVFYVRDGKLSPGAPFDLVFIGSQYDGKGGYSREFRSFSATHQLPESLYVRQVDTSMSAGEESYRQAWRNSAPQALSISICILGVMGLFMRRAWLTAHMKRLSSVHGAVLVLSAIILGFLFKAQPSITQVLTLIDGALNGFRWALYLSEPTLFVFWIGIAVVTLIWGRGIFCGWLCPFGALTELLFRLGRRLGLPKLELSQFSHARVRLLKYLFLVLIVAAFICSPALGEHLAEIEPFKTTFFILPWTRHWAFFSWWLLLILSALVWFRPFCRYLCPMGAGLAILSSWSYLRMPRRMACKVCQICRRGCEVRAFRLDGSIDPRECLSCLECEVNYNDDEVCPPLVGIQALIHRCQIENGYIKESRLHSLKEGAKPWQ